MTPILTAELLSICTNSELSKATLYVESFQEALHLYAIDTANRVGMFLANVGQESGSLRFREELWGPTDAQRSYDGRVDLGNDLLGDGYKYRGRGWLQTTGKENYKRLSYRLLARWPQMQVPDFVVQPDLLSSPEWCAVSAADFWEMNNINRFADAGDFDGTCDMVNRGHKTSAIGDSNGYAGRVSRWNAGRPALILAGFST